MDLLWQEYKAEQVDRFGYSAFGEHYKRWRQRLSLSMRQTHTPGERRFIDYAGPTVEITEMHSGEIRQAKIFVAVLGASNYTHVEATWSQQLPDWVGSHVRALDFFGGVTELWVPGCIGNLANVKGKVNIAVVIIAINRRQVAADLVRSVIYSPRRNTPRIRLFQLAMQDW